MSPRRRTDGLTPAEEEVAQLVASGLTYREIADARQCKLVTVQCHVCNAATKIAQQMGWDLSPRRCLTRYVRHRASA